MGPSSFCNSLVFATMLFNSKVPSGIHEDSQIGYGAVLHHRPNHLFGRYANDYTIAKCEEFNPYFLKSQCIEDLHSPEGCSGIKLVTIRGSESPTVTCMPRPETVTIPAGNNDKRYVLENDPKHAQQKSQADSMDGVMRAFIKHNNFNINKINTNNNKYSIEIKSLTIIILILMKIIIIITIIIIMITIVILIITMII